MFNFKKLMMFIGVLLVSQIIVSGISSAVLAKDGGFIYGDVNGDEAINAVDFAYMRQHLLGIISEFKSVNGIKAADVDGNGTFNAIDFAVMRKYLLGIIDEFPANQVVTPTITPTAKPSAFMQVKPSIVDVEMSYLTRNNIVLLWNKVEGAVSYKVYRDEVLIGTTSDSFLADKDIIEGINYTYSIKAVNNIGEHSLCSSKIIVNTIDAFINSDTVLEEDRYYMNLSIEDGAIIDLNGHTLNVKGDLLQGGTVNINSGNLKVGWNYIIYEDSILYMIEESDYVYVGENFTNLSKYCYSEDENKYQYFTAGVLEVKGDFNCGYIGNFVATGSNKVILSGKGAQIVNCEGVVFNELEIKNEAGVKFDSEIAIRKMEGNYKVAGELTLTHVGTITGDVTIAGDLKLKSGVLDLAGHIFSVTGNFTQSSEVLSNTVKVNKGRLGVYGNYCVGSETETYECYSMLQMTDEADYVYVGGDFTIMSGFSYAYEFNQGKRDIEYFTAGILEVKGDFNCMNQLDNFNASGSHKVILSGDSEQLVNNSFMKGEIHYSSFPLFNELEIKNETGVRFDSAIVIRKLKGNYKVIGELILCVIFPLVEDVKIECDLEYVGSNLDLDGHNLIVTGNFTQTSGDLKSTININKGKLKVNGNYTINTNPQFESYSYTKLQMTNEEDYVFVGGNFTTYSTADQSDCLTAGTIEVKGDFTQKSSDGSSLNFAASGTHKTILSGDSVQTITFEAPTTSSFNILKLTKPLDTGYIFNTTPVWKTLEQ